MGKTSVGMRRAISSSFTLGLAVVQLAIADPLPAPMPAPPVLPTPRPHIGFSGGDGSTCGKPVVITGANHETEGIRAQRWWIFTKNVGSKVVDQTVSSIDGRDLETFEIVTAEGKRKNVCFDITSFYGKP
jgi:hypothetical protein